MKLVQILIPTIFTLVIGCGGEQINAAVNTPTIQCGMCKETIESGLKKSSGITTANVDMKNKIASVTYDANKINLTKIEKIISELGYVANSTSANPDVYESLPLCCKIPDPK